jgi:hypothetical protein
MEGSKLGGQWKVPSLVANERFQAWWPMKGSKLGGQWKILMFGGSWKVLSLVTFGKRRKSILFTSFHFPTNKFYLNFFQMILRFYFTMVLNRYFTSFLPFL